MGSLEAIEKKKPINLLWGKPAPSLIPTHEMGLAAQKVFSNPTVAVAGMQYGDSPHAGYLPLRERLSAYLSNFYGSPDDIDHLCITGGASQGLTVVLQMLSDPIATKAVWMTAPCFFAARKIFEDAGLTGKLRGVNEFDDGSIDLEYLQREMTKLDSQPSLGKVRLVRRHLILRTSRQWVSYSSCLFLTLLPSHVNRLRNFKRLTLTSSTSFQPSPTPPVIRCL